MEKTVPYDDPDATDPMTLHGVEVQTDDDRAMQDMARCFTEEYARMGFGPDRIVKLFQTPGYAGPHLALKTLGEAAIQAIITECFERRGPVKEESFSVDVAGDAISLPVIREFDDCTGESTKVPPSDRSARS